MFDGEIPFDYLAAGPPEDLDRVGSDSPWLDAARDQGEGAPGVPAGLAELAPGAVLAALLSTIDPASLSGHDQVTLLKSCRRLISHLEAYAYRTVAAIYDSYGKQFPDRAEAEWRWHAAAAEVRAALTLTRRAAEMELEAAEDLFGRLPRLGDLLEAGRLDRRRAQLIADATAHLDEDTARQVVDQIAGDAPRLTTGQLRRRLRRLAISANPGYAAARYEHGLEERRVATEPTPEGTCHLMVLDLSPAQATAAADHVDHLARRLHKPGDGRTMDQLRADIAAALLSGHCQHEAGRRGHGVEIRVDLTTLAELSEEPGELAGYGPVVADVARQIAADANRISFTVTDPHTGEILHTGTTRRRPSAAQTRAVRARHPHCGFLGCLAPAHRSDIDHITPWAESRRTDIGELAPLCRRDHTIRHRAGWTYAINPDRTTTWISPLGHTYTSPPQPP